MAPAREEERMEQTRVIVLSLLRAGCDSVVSRVERRVVETAWFDLDVWIVRVRKAASVEDVLV